jgi:hypothetical protein
LGIPEGGLRPSLKRESVIGMKGSSSVAVVSRPVGYLDG